jgi:hypothetical protein
MSRKKSVEELATGKIGIATEDIGKGSGPVSDFEEHGVISESGWKEETVDENGKPFRTVRNIFRVTCLRSKPASLNKRMPCGHPEDQRLADGSGRCGPCYYKERHRSSVDSFPSNADPQSVMLTVPVRMVPKWYGVIKDVDADGDVVKRMFYLLKADEDKPDIIIPDGANLRIDEWGISCKVPEFKVSWAELNAYDHDSKTEM